MKTSQKSRDSPPTPELQKYLYVKYTHVWRIQYGNKMEESIVIGYKALLPMVVINDGKSYK